MDKQTLRSYAIVGARSRVEALKREEAQLLSSFPELARGNGRAVKAPPGRKRKRTFTAAQRKAIGERMKKFWAARRKAR